MLIKLLEESQNSKSLINSPERNAYKFISEVAGIGNDKRMKDIEVFKDKYSEFKDGSFIDTNRNNGQKMWSFIMEGCMLNKLHAWFLILSVNKNIANKYYNPDSTVVDMFQIKHVISK